MQHQAVSSSNIRSVGYDAVGGTLEIAFKSGGVYQYYGVPLEVYRALMGAYSKGKYFEHFIKKFYRYRRVG